MKLRIVKHKNYYTVQIKTFLFWSTINEYEEDFGTYRNKTFKKIGDAMNEIHRIEEEYNHKEREVVYECEI